MKKINLLLLILLVSTGTIFGQTAYNPFTQNIHFVPEPTVFGFECGSTPDVVFVAGLTTADDATNWQNEPLQVTICISGFEFNGPASTVVTGSYASNFTWAFSTTNPTTCIIGTQNQTLVGTGSNPLFPNPLSTGTIQLHLRVPETSPISTVLSVNVDLIVPAYMQTYNSPNDDAESTTTQTYCPLKISGTVFNDTTIANDTVDGTPFNNPSDTMVYANLVGPTGLVVASVPVGTNGYYEFTDVTPYTIYTVVLSTVQGTVGSPSTPNLPNGWTNVGEDCCDLIGTDGIDDGIITVELNNVSMPNVNFGIYTQPTGVLPTILKNFFVTEYNCSGVITWTTSQEVNASHVEILRKDNPNASFRAIATIQALGNSNEAHNYSFVDKTITKQDDYYQYKLKMVDIDGKFTYSEIKSLKFECESTSSTAFNFFPNPAVDEVNIVYLSDESDLILEVEVVDIAGRKLISKAQEVLIGSNFMTFDISKFATGNYFIKYQISENGTSGSVKFLKN